MPPFKLTGSRFALPACLSLAGSFACNAAAGADVHGRVSAVAVGPQYDATHVRDDECFIYVCGLKAMESGVLEAFRDVCRDRGADWDLIRTELLVKHRLHMETY
jgi:hypothetical protein